MDLQKPFRERRGSRWLARVGAVVGCAIALGGGYVASAGGLGAVTVFTNGLTVTPPPTNPLAYQYDPLDIAPGSDGALWFDATITNANSIIGRITPDGTISKFMLTNADLVGPLSAAPDGNVWFVDILTTASIDSITPSGTVTKFPVSSGTSDWPQGIAAAPDGDIWLTKPKAIGKLTPTGALTQYSAGLPTTSSLGGIAAGPDGNMWFADEGVPGAVGKITPAGTITEYTAGLGPSNRPTEIAQGPDGNMWFVDGGIGRITPGGQITQFSVPIANGTPSHIVAGPDGNMWFTLDGTAAGGVGEISPDGTITEFDLSPNFITEMGLAIGSDGNLWVTGGTAQTGSYVPAIARIGIGAPAASIAPPAVTGSAQEGDAQSCSGATWSSWAGHQPSLIASTADGYQWLLDGNVIAGETAPSYTPTAGDLGHRLSCMVTGTYTLSSVTVSASSAPVTVVAPGTTTTTTTTNTTTGGGTGGGGGGGTTTTTGAAPTEPPPAGTTTTTTTTTPAAPTGPAPRAPSSSRAVAKVSIVSVTTVHLDTKSPKLHVSLKASKACQAVLVLLGPNGKVLARWTLHLKAGNHQLTFVLPTKARHAGRDHLRVQTGTAKPTTVAISLRP